MPAIPYRNPAVRDLYWACFSAPLIRCDQLPEDAAGRSGPINARFPLTNERLQWLDRLDAHPAPLVDFLCARPSQRLGLYFERLWHFFLDQDPRLELLAHNLPVRDKGKTLGEFDCLYYCRDRDRHYHLELAVKYYLAHPTTPMQATSSPWRCWLGPNSRDRLDLKLSRLLEHQTRLSESDAGREVLTTRGITSPQRQMEVKGYLFQPVGQALPAPAGFDPERTFDRWLRLAELPAFLERHGAVHRRYRILPRLQWLSPAAAAKHCLSRADLIAFLPAKVAAAPRLLATCDESGAEIERFFVVDDQWPGIAADPM